ncbi:MAG TPA: hypothetical protein GYA06_13300 [Chloroflexi bacterium]|nr:hypothetical protein [Chloroflexota bacterium]
MAKIRRPRQQRKREVWLFHSTWGLTLLSLAMLLIGFLAGWFLRPVITGNSQSGAQEPMARAVAQTRHFLGNPDAPITMLEFSDFQ